MNTNTETLTADPFATLESTYALFGRLRKLWLDCGPSTNKHDQARILIAACLDEGIVQGPRIVGTLAKLGFNNRHVGKLLTSMSGSDPARYDWSKDEDGEYHLHPNPTLETAAQIVI